MSASSVKFTIEEFRFIEVVILRSARLKAGYQCEVGLKFLVFVIVRQAGGIFWMAIKISLSDFCPLYIHLDESERTVQPGIDTIDGNLRNGLVFSHRLAVEGRDIGDITIGIYEVYVRVLIDSNEPLGLRTPGDMSDISI